MTQQVLSEPGITWEQDYWDRINPELMTALLRVSIPVLGQYRFANSDPYGDISFVAWDKNILLDNESGFAHCYLRHNGKPGDPGVAMEMKVRLS